MSEEKKFDQIKYNTQYKKDHYDELRVLVPKDSGYRERIKELANRDKISVSAWIVRAIEKELEWYE